MHWITNFHCIVVAYSTQYKKPEKATSCLVFGIIVAIFNLLGIIIGAVGGSGFNFVSLVIGLVLPVLFIVGAVMNKKSN